MNRRESIWICSNSFIQASFLTELCLDVYICCKTNGKIENAILF